MSEQQPQSNRYSPIVDSALVLAMISAVCYVAGFLIELREASELGLPLHLLPESSIQSIVLSGSIYLFFVATVALLFVLIVNVTVLLRFCTFFIIFAILYFPLFPSCP